MELVYLDVSCLPPPEPMTQIIRALSLMTDVQCLQIKHRREPFPLYEKLAPAGWIYHCQQLGDEHFNIYICRQNHQKELTQLKTSL